MATYRFGANLFLFENRKKLQTYILHKNIHSLRNNIAVSVYRCACTDVKLPFSISTLCTVRARARPLQPEIIHSRVKLHFISPSSRALRLFFSRATEMHFSSVALLFYLALSITRVYAHLSSPLFSCATSLNFSFSASLVSMTSEMPV